MIGKTIGKYRIVGQLGRGGMGTVYKAVDTTLDREVAIKILNAELADTEMMGRFRAEATIFARLNHPEIATIHEFFRSDPDLLMVVEFVRGETLEKVLDCLGPMPPDHAAYVIDKILSALEHTHRAGIVHRDMKPANVMVTEHGGVKIMDFGVALVRGAERMTLDGTLMGTPAYMPPEQVLGYEVDGRADLYSVGVVFYRLLTGVLPFTAETAMDMLQKQISDAPTPLHVHRKGLPDWCERIVQRALAKSPGDRFQTAEEFRDTLAQAVGLVTTTELTKALSVSVADLETTPPRQPAVLERFGPTPVRGIAAQTPVLVAPNLSISTTDPAPIAVSTPPAVSRGNPLAGNAEGSWNVLPKSHSALTYSLLAILTVSATVLAIVALWRPGTVPVATTADDAPPATQSTTSSTAVTPPSSARTAPVRRASKPFAVPFAFDARVLLSDGDRQYERACQVLLTDGRINVQQKDEGDLLHTLPYDAVLSISYSRGRHPLWNTRAGPTPVLRAGRGVLGIFRRARHWVSLRTRNPNARFVVLRLGNETQARRVIIALEERTGRTAEIVVERKQDK